MKSNDLSYSCSYFLGPLKKIRPNKTIKLSEFVTMLSSKEILEIQQKYDSGDEETKDKIKNDIMPYATLQAIVKQRKTEGVEKRSGLFIIDVDKIDNLDEVRTTLENDPYVLLLHTTISGKGLRGIMRLDVEQCRHIQTYHSVENYLKTTYDIEIDPSCKDIVRACKLAYDKNPFVNEESEEIEESFIKEWLPKTKKRKTFKPKNQSKDIPECIEIDINGDIRDYQKTKISDLVTAIVYHSEEGQKHKELMKASSIAGGYVYYGIISWKDAIDLLYDAIELREETVKDMDLAHKTIENSIIFGMNNPFDIHEYIAVNERKFWKIYKMGDKVILEIPITDTYRFLNRRGFNIFQKGSISEFIQVNDNIIKKAEKADIIQYMMSHIFSLPWDIGFGITKDDLEEKFRNKLNTLFSANQLSTNLKLNPEFNSDRQELAHFYFNNEIIKVTKTGLTSMQYADLTKSIWESSIMIDEFTGLSISFEEAKEHSEYAKFVRNVANNDEKRVKSLYSIIGYLLHSYKDPHLTKAIILCDEVISENPEGGTGKGVFIKGIEEFKNSTKIDGKSLTKDNRFFFQQIEADTEIAIFDDIKPDFDFQKLFPALTEGVGVEKKYLGKMHIDYEDSPKFIITTNYTVTGEGSSHDRRKETFEFSHHYTDKFSPYDEFGHNLFDDWNEKQYQYFYRFMLGCVELFLKDGLINAPEINIKRKKLIQLTESSFVDFVVEEIEIGTEYEKPKLLRRFLELNPEFEDQRWFTQRTFNKWLRKYGEVYGYKIGERLSDNKQLIQFINDSKEKSKSNIE